MSAVRQMKRRATRARGKQADAGPYVVRRVFIQAEVSLLDASGGRVRQVQVTEPKAVHEVEFPPWLWEWFAAGGLTPENRPVAKEDKAKAS